MNTPILVTPPDALPVTLDEAKKHLREATYDADGEVLPSDDDPLIEGLLRAAVSYLDGWAGILGRCLVEQTWRQDFDRFDCPMRVALVPVTEIVSITYRNGEGQVATIAASNYAVVTDADGPRIYWDRAFSAPSGLYEQGAVSVTYKAGYRDGEDGNSTVPAALKVAILLLVGTWFDNREATVSTTLSELPFAVNALIAPFRRISI